MILLTAYRILGLPLDASPEAIRERYLERVKQNPPARNPERFQKIAAAYEALQDDRVRVRTAIRGSLEYPDFESALLELVRACPVERRSPGLQELLRAEGLLA